MATETDVQTATAPSPAFPPNRLKTTMRALLSDPKTRAQIKALVEERAGLVPPEAREELKGPDDTPTNPTERRMTAEVLAKHTSAKNVERWQEIVKELETLRKGSGCARGDKHCGHLLSNLMEWLVAELLMAATKTAHGMHRSKLRPEYILVDAAAEASLWYPLVVNLPSFIDRASKDDDEEEEEEAPEKDDAGEPADIADDDDDSMPSPQCHNSAIKVNQKIAEITGFKTAMTQEIRAFLQHVVVELLSQLAEMVRAALKFKGQSTLNEEVLQFVLHLLYIQGGRADEGEELIKRVSVHFGSEENAEGKSVPKPGMNLGADFAGLKALPKLETKRRPKRADDQAAPVIPKPSGSAEAAEDAEPKKAKGKGKKAAEAAAEAPEVAPKTKKAETKAKKVEAAAPAPPAEAAPAPAKGKGKKAAAETVPAKKTEAAAPAPPAEAAPAPAKGKGKKAAEAAPAAPAAPAAEAPKKKAKA
jgi:hypothetical protein